MKKKIRVLVCDDSAFVRQILSRGLAADEGIEVVGSAADPYEARDRIVELRPDVMTLDVEMPRMNGVEFLRKLMPQYPIPVVMVSSLTEQGKQITLDALAAGAVDFVQKPKGGVGHLDSVLLELRAKVKIAAAANVSHLKRSREEIFNRPAVRGTIEGSAKGWCRMIAIGASTGGTEAVAAILRRMPKSTPGIVIVQHMPPGFTQLFAQRLNSNSELEVKEAADGDIVTNGRALVAPGGMQLRVVKVGAEIRIKIQQGDLVCGHAPSVEVMFDSVATACAKQAIGVILTGMGQDGAQALRTMRDAGARTLGQDERSCVVYGMPKVAWEKGGVEKQVALETVPEAIDALLRGGEG
jgi:two-component system chemotaxis response regulator CheB